jgi:FtsH-binding integral membrane protein
VAPGAIASAAQITAAGAVGLTMVVFVTRADFSLLRGLLRWGGLLALAAIVAAVALEVALGAWFNLAVVGLAGAAILHDTDRLRRRFGGHRYVAAALSLFASVAMMFWHVLRLTIRARR